MVDCRLTLFEQMAMAESFISRLYDDPTKKGSVIIKDLNDVRVMDKREVYRILKKGSEKRRTAETKMNAHSSRSVVRFRASLLKFSPCCFPRCVECVCSTTSYYLLEFIIGVVSRIKKQTLDSSEKFISVH